MPESESTASRRPRLLLLENERSPREMMRHYFGHLGYDVWGTERPDEARAVLDFRSFDLFIANLAPGDDGLEAAFGVLEHARDRNPGIGILVLSGCHDPELASRCRRHGADQVLLEPLPLHTLALCVARLVPPNAPFAAQSRT